jgi:hypothetical protein
VQQKLWNLLTRPCWSLQQVCCGTRQPLSSVGVDSASVASSSDVALLSRREEKLLMAGSSAPSASKTSNTVRPLQVRHGRYAFLKQWKPHERRWNASCGRHARLSERQSDSGVPKSDNPPGFSWS